MNTEYNLFNPESQQYVARQLVAWATYETMQAPATEMSSLFTHKVLTLSYGFTDEEHARFVAAFVTRFNKLVAQGGIICRAYGRVYVWDIRPEAENLLIHKSYTHYFTR